MTFTCKLVTFKIHTGWKLFSFSWEILNSLTGNEMYGGTNRVCHITKLAINLLDFNFEFNSRNDKHIISDLCGPNNILRMNFPIWQKIQNEHSAINILQIFNTLNWNGISPAGVQNVFQEKMSTKERSKTNLIMDSLICNVYLSFYDCEIQSFQSNAFLSLHGFSM